MTETNPDGSGLYRKERLMGEGKMEVEFYIVSDSDGDFTVHHEIDQALELYTDDIGGSAQRDVLKVKLIKPLPQPDEVSGEIHQSKGDLRLEVQR